MVLAVGAILVPTTLLAKTDKYRLSWRTNPSSSMVVGWNQLDGDNGTVYYGTKDFGTEWEKYPFKQSIDRVQKYGVLNNRFSRLTKLKSDTAYYFVIKDSNSISQRFWFKTDQALLRKYHLLQVEILELTMNLVKKEIA